ncbi:hypothetical protein Tco_1400331 [Tanacetum coccineum]
MQVADALSKKEREKPQRVRAMAVIIQSKVKGLILAAQDEAFKDENVIAEGLNSTDRTMGKEKDEAYTKLIVYGVPLLGMKNQSLLQQPEIPEWKWEKIAVDFITKLPRSRKWSDADWVIVDRLNQIGRIHVQYERTIGWTFYIKVLENDAKSVGNAFRYEYGLSSLDGWTKRASPVLWAEIGDSRLIRPELVQETTDIRDRLKAARDRQKSYADNRRKP